MKKIIKALFCLALVALMCFAPKAVNHPGPGPDDRPISYAFRVRL